jgi:SAM-dependent methyltransferase
MTHQREADLVAHYDSKPLYYSPLATKGFLQHLFQVLGVDVGAELVDGSVLDIGCGDGRLLRHLGPPIYVGVDYSKVRIGRARVLTDPVDGWDVYHADVYGWLESCDRRFDLVVAVEVLEHLEEPRRVVEAALGLLNPGGVFVGSVPVDLPYGAHLQLFVTEDDVRSVLAPRLVVEDGGHWLCRWDDSGLQVGDREDG